MYAYRKPLGSVTARSSRISDFIKFGMAMATQIVSLAWNNDVPAIPLLPALDIQGYGVHFYRIFLSVYGS